MLNTIILYVYFLISLVFYVYSNDVHSNSITPHWTLLNITPMTFCIKYHNTIATRAHNQGAPCMLTHSPIEGNDTFETMQKKNFYYFNDWGCLFNADAPHHAVVKFNKMVCILFHYTNNYHYIKLFKNRIILEKKL